MMHGQTKIKFKFVDFWGLGSWKVLLCRLFLVRIIRKNVLPSSWWFKGSQTNAQSVWHSSWIPQPLKVKTLFTFETSWTVNSGHSNTFVKKLSLKNTVVETGNLALYELFTTLSWSAKVCLKRLLEQFFRHKDSQRSWPTSSFELQP